jgi:FkbM family methyltransferase
MGTGIVTRLNKLLRKKRLEICDYNEYEHRLKPVRYKWLQKYNIGTVLDIGANTGQYAVKLRKLFPDAVIHSFEPIPDSFQQLERVFKGDNKHYAHQIALSDCDEMISFHVNQNPGSSSMLNITDKHTASFPNTNHHSTIQVEAKKLDTIFPQLRIEGEILAKIDVQGAEQKVFAGGTDTFKKVKIIFIETSFVELYKNQWLFNDLYLHLTSLNFSLCGIDATTQSLIDGSLLQSDMFFIRN